MFHSLNLTNKWNIPLGYRADAFGNVCYNCGALDHTSNKYPLSCNEARITKAKEAREKSVTEGCGSGGCGCGHGLGDCRGGRGADCANTRRKWGTNKGDPATPGTNKSTGDGVKEQNEK